LEYCAPSLQLQVSSILQNFAASHYCREVTLSGCGVLVGIRIMLIKGRSSAEWWNILGIYVIPIHLNKINNARPI
jgi:hypothetical protein